MNALIFFLLLLSGSLYDHFSSEKRKLVWCDEFDYSGRPDSTRWNYDLGDGCPTVCGWGNNEAQFYTKSLNNAHVENGMLTIEAIKETKNGKEFTSARLVTKNKGDWKYGRVEVRAKLPHGNGTWPAIWMLPSDWKYGGWPASGEIDIMEHVGFDPGVIHGTLHSEKYNHVKQTQQEGKTLVPDCSEVFHIYSVEWTENQIDFYVDQTPYHTVQKKPADDFRGWPFDQRFHVILNLAVGGNWGGMKGIDPTIWPQKMIVDYVRVYQ
ncbi:MAG: glycoside hydrolase family 16 protein [Bacteroidetes bacterium]|nr:glycoside hydrolase family 16 protein [Bacteroidota bacterium]MBS1982202.1 glycoside hydrolase family 16 protein [Bacteroidota bacterium]